MPRRPETIRIQPDLLGVSVHYAARLGLPWAVVVEVALVAFLCAHGDQLGPELLALERKLPPVKMVTDARGGPRVRTTVRLHEGLFAAAVVHGARYDVSLAGVVESALVELLAARGVTIRGWRPVAAPLAPVEPWRTPLPALRRPRRAHAASKATRSPARAPRGRPRLR